MRLNEFTQKYDEDGATKEFKIKTRTCKLIVVVAKMRGNGGFLFGRQLQVYCMNFL
jgi:hypothetical protein